MKKGVNVFKRPLRAKVIFTKSFLVLFEIHTNFSVFLVVFSTILIEIDTNKWNSLEYISKLNTERNIKIVLNFSAVLVGV